MGFGSRRPMRVVLLLNAVRLSRARENRGWKQVAWSDESRLQVLNAYGSLRKWRQAHEAMDLACQVVEFPSKTTASLLSPCWLLAGWMSLPDFSVINWSPRSPDLNPIEHLWDILEQFVKCHHTTPTNRTELWTVLANIWQVTPLERFQKNLLNLCRNLVATIIKVRGGPTCY
ncbi:transposable element Tc1 transposase [Trichonephila clavipes]|nr:transposable element Tc1 transposase [Trichonephila clavipes]